MSYFKQLGAIDKSRFQTASVAVSQQQGVATPQSISFSETKAKWPRCNVTVRDGRTGTTSTVQGYLYKFADGRTICTKDWNQDHYAMVVKGQSPTMGHPDLSKVRPGSPEYFRWLCKAQGDGADPAVQAVRIGFDKANLTWQPTVDSKMRKWTGYPSAPHPRVLPQNISACAKYANQGTSVKNWEFRAYDYSVNVQGKIKEGTRPDGTPGTAEHRASECEKRVPPELVEACKAALAKNDGTSIESFEKQVNNMTPEQLEELIFGGAAAGAALPTPPPMGIPKLYLYGGAAAAVGLVAFLTLGKKR